MKKSLSAIVSLAMAFSMFSSVAFGAEATTTTSTTTTATATAAKKTVADFKDLADIDAGLKAKIEALLAKGVFEGTSEDSFGIKENMTRAQFAKVLTLIYGVEVDMNVKASSFSDVKADDNANAWAIPFIEAAKKKGLIDGMTDSTFAPGENVTLGQFATALVKGLGKTVSTTGTPWYSDAIKQAVELKVLPEGVDGAKTATRADLVVGAYGGQEAYNAQQGLNVEAKAVGASKVEVKFNKAVDDTKAKFDLKRGTTALATDVKFADDKKSATLTVKDVKLLAGEHTVTVTGLEKEVSAKFTAEDEKVVKIDFLNAGDTIAYAPKVRVAFKAANQYGEAVSMSAGNFSVFATTGSPVIKKTDAGDMYVELATNTGTVAQNVSQVSINIYDNSRNISASKIFKVGTAPYVAKVELGQPKYSNAVGLSKSGEYATIALTEIDQYGNVLVEGSGHDSITKLSGLVTPNLGEFNDINDASFKYNGDGVRQLEVKLKKDAEKNEEYTVSVYGGSSAATTKVKTVANKVAAKIELLNDGSLYAEGDTDKYVTIVAYDANGEKLSQDDIVQNAKDGRFTINVSGAFAAGATTDVPASILDAKNGAISLAGEHRGKIHLAKVSKGTGYIFAAIVTTTGQSSNTQQSYNVSNPRFAVTMRNNGADLAGKIVAGASTETKIKIYDQNNAEYKKQADGIDITENGKNVTYDVYVTAKIPTGVTVNLDGTGDLTNGVGVKVDTDKFFDKKIKVSTATNTAINEKIEVKVQLRKVVKGSSPVEVIDDSVKTYTKEIVVVNPQNEKLTYELNTVGDLFQTIEDKTLQDASIFDNAAFSHQHKEVKLTAKDSGGNIVAIDGPSMIESVTSSVYTVATTAKHPHNGKAYVLGNKAGTSTISVFFKNAKGEYQQLSTDVTVKADPVTVASMTSKASRVDVLANINGKLANKVMELKVKDNYGIEYNHDSKIHLLADDNNPATTNDGEIAYDAINAFDAHLQVRYGLTDVALKTTATGTAADEVTVDQTTGVLTVGSNVASFNLTAYANGKSTMTPVVVKNPS